MIPVLKILSDYTPEYKTEGSACFVRVESLSDTARGEGGFGSTGDK